MDRKTLYINSAQRDVGGTDGNFTITRVVQEFPYPPKSAKLLTASIPFTWGNVVASNNTFSVTEFGVGTDSFIIPAGNYTGIALASEIQSLLNDSFILLPTFTVSYNLITQLFTFSNDANVFDITFTNVNSAATLLGFTPGTTTPGAPALSFTSTAPALLTPVFIGNNTFSVTEFGVGTDDFVLPSGNYTGTTLAAEVAALLNASSILLPTFTVSFSSTTLLFTFSNSAHVFDITFATVNSAALLLGFTSGTTTPGAPALSFTSTATAQLLPDYEIFICSDLVRGSDNGDMLWYPNYSPTATNQSQILARVPITGCYSGVINYMAHVQLPFYNVAQSMFAKGSYSSTPVSINFFLMRPSGLALELNGYHWSAELVFDFNLTGSA